MKKKLFLKLDEIRGSQLPLGYQKLLIKKIPPKHAEENLVGYNRQYNHSSYLTLRPDKPLSKIIE